MDIETLAEQLYNVMLDKMVELEASVKAEMKLWAECEEDGKELFRAMAAYVLENVEAWTQL